MAKNYFEPRVDGEHITTEPMRVNGHDFTIFLQYLTGASEWYAGIVGTLPDYLEDEYQKRKPGLIARAATQDECRSQARKFLSEAYPEWPEEKLAAWKKKVEDAAEAERAAAEAKKKKAAEAKKAAGKAG